MTPEEFKEFALSHAEVSKSTMVSMLEADVDFIPQILIVPKDKNEKWVVGTLSGLGTGELKQGLISVLNSPGIPTPEVIVISSDTYSMRADLPEDATPEDAKALAEKYGGRLAHYFAMGDPRVYEALSVMVITEEYSANVVLRYRKTATDGVEWDDPDYSEPLNWSYHDVVGIESALPTPRKYPICPLCGGFIPNNEHPGEYVGALSRRDNKTEICSECGQREAMEDFMRYVNGKEDS